MSIETYLTDKMVVNTKELSELLGRTPRTLLRWQDTMGGCRLSSHH